MRTCDKVSLSSDRIVPKDECIFRCLNSLVKSLEQLTLIPYTLHIIDDRSSEQTREKIKQIAHNATFTLLADRDDSMLDPRQKSRFSVKTMYDYIYTLPESDLIYIVEDDYLHYPDSIERMIEAWSYFTHVSGGKNVGIFPQDFPELYFHPRNPYNNTYVTNCLVMPGPDRYYRTTWYTHESFFITLHALYKYRDHFDALLKIGTDPAFWEGNTISNAWSKDDVMMLMPMKALAIHVSKKEDIPFFNTDFESLWELNNIS